MYAHMSIAITALAAIAAMPSPTFAAASGGVDPLASLSSTFDDASALDGWQRHAPVGWAPAWRRMEVRDGALEIEPVSGGWFEDYQSGHLYRPVTGDFIVTTRIHVSGTAGSPLPKTSFSLAGLLLRAPRNFNAGNWQPNQEDWLFFSVGSAADPEALPETLRVTGRPQFEIKSTDDSRSTLKISDAPGRHVDLRVARDGSIFTLLYREARDDAEWAVLDQFIRSDLPPTLWVGITAYSDWDSIAGAYPDYEAQHRNGPASDNADLRARVEWIRFRRPTFQLGLPIATLVGRRQADYTRD